MNKEFVPYKLAIRMKALGFDEPCFGYFRNEDGHLFPYSYYEGQFDDLTLAPLWQQAFRWIYEKYNHMELVEEFYVENRLSWRLHTEHMETKLNKLIELVELVEQKLKEHENI